jgi:hypothetical protein
MPGPFTTAAGNYVPFVASDQTAKYNARQYGVFGSNPLMTPKYARNNGTPRDAEFKDTLARLYISVSDLSDPDRSKYLATLPGDAATQALAKVLLGTNATGGTGFIDFFLSSANEPFQEIMQVDKVLADDYVAFFYGQQPPVFQYSGTLLNSMQDDQRSGFARAYQLLLRGTQLARRGALARLRYDSVIVSGVLTAQQQQLNADNELAVPFSFSFLVKEYVVLQNAAFNKTTVQDYIQLAADSAIAALQPVNTSTNAQANTTAVTPTTPAATSVAGAAQPTTATNAALNVLQQLVSKASAVLATSSATSNVKGTINPTPPTPPAPPSGTA